MKIFYAGIDKKYLLSSLQTDCLISCKIIIDVFKHDEQFIKRVEFYSWNKELAETVIDVIYRDIFDYLVIRYFIT